MDQVYLFGLASDRASWLSQRQATVAENVANVNTPGYKAKDITSFESVLADTGMSQRASDPRHLAGYGEGSGRERPTADRLDANTWDVKHSGNSVAIEEEMLKAGEVSRDYSLNTSIVKSFHRMLMMTVKG